jgi:Virulence factor BrkB
VSSFLINLTKLGVATSTHRRRRAERMPPPSISAKERAKCSVPKSGDDLLQVMPGESTIAKLDPVSVTASPADAPTGPHGPGLAEAAKKFVMLAKDAGARWADDSCYRLGASLSYYALYSIFPLLLLSVTAVGFFLSEDDARQKVLSSVAAPSPAFRMLLDQTLQSMQSLRTAAVRAAARGRGSDRPRGVDSNRLGARPPASRRQPRHNPGFGRLALSFEVVARVNGRQRRDAILDLLWQTRY